MDLFRIYFFNLRNSLCYCYDLVLRFFRGKEKAELKLKLLVFLLRYSARKNLTTTPVLEIRACMSSLIFTRIGETESDARLKMVSLMPGGGFPRVLALLLVSRMSTATGIAAPPLLPVPGLRRPSASESENLNKSRQQAGGIKSYTTAQKNTGELIASPVFSYPPQTHG